MAEKTTKVIVRTNDGKEQETTISNYDAEKVAATLNDPGQNVVAIGDVIVQRSFVTGVRPVVE